jgi:hypothetical protein
MISKALGIVAGLAVLASAAARSTGVPRRTSAEAHPEIVQIEMRNVHLHVDADIILDVTRLRGTMISTSQHPPVFDDPKSYVLNIAAGSVSMDMTSLQNLMNRRAFAYEGAPLENVKVQAKEGRLEMTGTLRKGIHVPFATKASVGVMDDGKLRLHTESVKAAGVPAKGLLNLFGLKLENLMDLKQRRGIDVQENDIVISPGELLPPPAMRGRLTSAAVRGNRLVQTFGDPNAKEPPALKPPAPGARNYIYFSGGDIRFGKLTMHEADLQLIDLDPRDPFDFFPARYDAQLVAGYSKNTPQHGLKTYMPDFDDLVRRK